MLLRLSVLALPVLLATLTAAHADDRADACVLAARSVGDISKSAAERTPAISELISFRAASLTRASSALISGFRRWWVDVAGWVTSDFASPRLLEMPAISSAFMNRNAPALPPATSIATRVEPRLI